MGFDFGNERLNEPKAAFATRFILHALESGGGSES